MTAEQVIAVGTVIAAVAAFAAAMIAGNQLKSLADSLKLNGLAAVLAMETEMNARLERLDEFNFKIQCGEIDQTIPPEQLEVFHDRLRSLANSYLNSVDRLAFCILKGYLPERDWRGEYKPMLERIFEGDNAELVKSFDNIVALHQKWQNQTGDYSEEYDPLI
jgi:hypothetical protein